MEYQKIQETLEKMKSKTLFDTNVTTFSRSNEKKMYGLNIPSGIALELKPFYLLCRVLQSTRNVEVAGGGSVATELLPLRLVVGGADRVRRAAL